MIRTAACTEPSAWWCVCETARSFPSLEAPSVNQRSSCWLCSASKMLTAKGSSRTVEASANVTPCLAILASAFNGSQVICSGGGELMPAAPSAVGLHQYPFEHLDHQALLGVRQAAQTLDLLLQLRGRSALAGLGGLTDQLIRADTEQLRQTREHP